MSNQGFATLESFQSDNLIVVPEPPARLVMTGTITAREPTRTVQPHLEKVHAQAMASGIKELVVDVRGLTFVNSSAIRVFINWAMLVKGEPEDRRYKIQFLTSRSVTWQRTSLPTLQSLAPDIVGIAT
jgi:hypothetical protein